MAAYALTEEAAWRATLGSSRVERQDGDDVLIPDFTRAMASDLLFLETHPEAPEPGDFAPFVQPGTRAWDEFFEKRKVVERTDENGQVFVSVTSNRVDVLDGKVNPYRPSLMPVKVKRFDVAALLTDHSLVEKFHITGTFRAGMRNLAAVDTARAALRLRDHVRTYQGYEYAEVVPGAYASSWKAARETLKLHAARFPSVSVAVNAWFIGRKLFMYGDPEDEEGWRVFGPETVAPLVRMVHAMVAATTPASVAFALGPELTLLDIDIHDGEQVLCPVRERHAGPHDELPLLPSSFSATFLSYEQRARLDQLTVACEVLAVDGENCATAVRVSSKYVLVNSHVVNEGGVLTCNGKGAYPVRLLSRDLWLVRCHGDDVVWPLREVQDGEEVFLCYRRHDEVQYGGPTVVRSNGADIMTLVKHESMRYGISGAAVVATSDFALLGVYDGLSLTQGLAATYSSDMYTEMCMLDESDFESRTLVRAEVDDGVIADVKSRGLGKVVSAAMAALVPLYSGSQHVGMGYSMNGCLYTSCDPSSTSLSVGVGQAPLIFEEVSVGLYRTATSSLPEPPAVRRLPAYGDKVFVVGCDAEGYYSSIGAGSISRVGLGARTFGVSGLAKGALTFTGGFVLSCADAAVLGTCTATEEERRGVFTVACVALPPLTERVSRVHTAEAQLVRVFPFLRPSSWGRGVADVVLSRVESELASLVPTQDAFAMVGRSALGTAVRTELLRREMPLGEWHQYTVLKQTVECLAVECRRLGLSRLAVTSRCVAPDDVVCAKLVWAIAGAVYMFEKPESFVTYCTVLNVLPLRSLEESDPDLVRVSSDENG